MNLVNLVNIFLGGRLTSIMASLIMAVAFLFVESGNVFSNGVGSNSRL